MLLILHNYLRSLLHVDVMDIIDEVNMIWDYLLSVCRYSKPRFSHSTEPGSNQIFNINVGLYHNVLSVLYSLSKYINRNS